MAPSRVERRAIEVSGWWQELGSRLGTGAVGGRNEAPEHRRRLPPERAHHIDDLDDAQAALAELVLGNERLMLSETPGDRDLAQAVALAQGPQLGAEHDLARRAQGVAHGERPRSKTAASPHNPDS